MAEKESVAEYAARMRVFIKNQQELPPEMVANYAGKWIAWSPDGASILASADDVETLDGLVRAAGESPHLCTLEYVEER